MAVREKHACQRMPSREKLENEQKKKKKERGEEKKTKECEKEAATACQSSQEVG